MDSALAGHKKTVSTLWTIEDVASYLQIAKGTLRKWRQEGKGPPVTMVGGAIRYRPDDVEAWLDAQQQPERS
jgi:excisionase family DNA binding protein